MEKRRVLEKPAVVRQTATIEEEDAKSVGHNGKSVDDRNMVKTPGVVECGVGLGKVEINAIFRILQRPGENLANNETFLLLFFASWLYPFLLHS